MTDFSCLTVPAVAFTIHGILPVYNFDHLLRVSRREYDAGWYDSLEVVDCNGNCVVVHSVSIVKESFLAKFFGGVVQVRVDVAEQLGAYDVSSLQNRVLEWLDIYPCMYESAGTYDELTKRVRAAASVHEIIDVVVLFSK